MYSVGLGIINGVAALVNKTVGHQVLVGSGAIKFVAIILVGLAFYKIGLCSAVARAILDLGVDETVTDTLAGLLISYFAPIASAYIGALITE